jgi:hypothetical protein
MYKAALKWKKRPQAMHIHDFPNTHTPTPSLGYVEKIDRLTEQDQSIKE